MGVPNTAPVCVTCGCDSFDIFAIPKSRILRRAGAALVGDEKEVLRLDVAVDDADRVRGAEPTRGLDEDAQSFVDRQRRVVAKVLGEGRTAEQLHDEVHAAVGRGGEVAQRDNGGMTDARGRTRLLLEAHEDVRSRRNGLASE